MDVISKAIERMSSTSPKISDELNYNERTKILKRILSDSSYIPTFKENALILEVTELDYGKFRDGDEELDEKSLARFTNLRGLEMSGCHITDISFLTGLTSLQRLGLSNNGIRDISALAGLTSLQSLDVSSNQISDLTALENLTSLIDLQLGDNRITDVTPLANLTSLIILDLCINEISDVTPLTNLTSLVQLDISGNKITDISDLGNLVSLQSLSAFHNQISDIKVLAKLTALLVLWLKGNQVSDITALAGLTGMKLLSLSDNHISDIMPLASLTSLNTLELDANRISDITPLTSLTVLKKVDLSNNRISDITALAGLTELEEIDISGTDITDIRALQDLKSLRNLGLINLSLDSIPYNLVKQMEVFDDEYMALIKGIHMKNVPLPSSLKKLLCSNDRTLIDEWYKSQENADVLNEGKVVFLGNGGVGKTYTIKRIRNNGAPIDESTSTTQGIEIDDIDINVIDYDTDKDNFQIHFWDFGGQGKMHSVHRCFLTNHTVYFIVLSNRWPDLRAQARYWLRNVETFTDHASVIIGINKWDDVDEEIGVRELQEAFSLDIGTPIRYTATKDSKEEFQKVIKKIVDQAILQNTLYQEQIPHGWNGVRRELMDMKEDYIDQAGYHEICDRHGIKPELRSSLLEWYNQLGICFSYHLNEVDHTELPEYQILNPRWLLNAIYILIINRPEHPTPANKKGMFTEYELSALLEHPQKAVISDMAYKPEELHYILDIMQKFRLTYKTEDGSYFIPAHCEGDSPENLVPQQYHTHTGYILHFKYLPDSVIHQLMMDCYGDLNTDMLWSRGLRLDAKWAKITAIVQMDMDDEHLKIDLYSSGDVPCGAILNNLREKLTLICGYSRLNLEILDETVRIYDGDLYAEMDMDDALAYKVARMPSMPLKFTSSNHSSAYRKLISMDEILGTVFSKKDLDLALSHAAEMNIVPSRQYVFNYCNFTQQTISPENHELAEKLVETLTHMTSFQERQLESIQQLNDQLTEMLKAQTDNAELLAAAAQLEKAKKEKESPDKALKDVFEKLNTSFQFGENAQKTILLIGALLPKIQAHIPDFLKLFGLG